MNRRTNPRAVPYPPGMPLTARLPLLLAAALCAAPALHAQTAATHGDFSMPPSFDMPAYTPTLTFDVTSIRESQPAARSVDMGITIPAHTGQFDAHSITLQILVQIAFGSGPFKIVNGPDWLSDRYFRIEAKCDHSVDEQIARLTDEQSRLEKLHMLQALLAERFQLKAHWEQHDGSVFNMTIAKGGLKMQPTPTPPAPPEGPGGASAPPPAPGPGVHASGGPQGIEIDGDHFMSRALANLFATQLANPVVDKTGLPATATYTFKLQFAREGSSAPDAYPALLTAAEEQLGLKLESAKGKVDTLVIDHVELPSLN
ncbi:MAG: TIGR03435 family protein [Acidobacteriota bacterium]|nr:TIGR03435 family protein [Acidobacteriota bacterium]